MREGKSVPKPDFQVRFEQEAQAGEQKNRFFAAIQFALLALCVANYAHAQPASFIHLSTFSTHSRLTFQVDESVQTEWKTVSGGFELTLKGVWLADLGAPLGGEAEWTGRVTQALKDSRLKEVKFKEIPGGTVVIGKWRFPEGNERPANPQMERFDFKEKAPSRYVIDFWSKKGPTVAQVEALKTREKRVAEEKAEQDRRKKRAERKIASEKAKADAEDLLKHCRAPLQDSEDVFLSFRPVHERPDLSKFLRLTTADSDFEYVVPKSEDREAQYMRLALDLYKQGKMGLAIKTSEFFEKEHPGSRFRTQMTFLKANAMIKLGLAPAGEKLLRELIDEAKDTQFALYSELYLSALAYQRESHLQALDGFLWLIQYHSSHPKSWIFHLAVAESLYSLKQTDRAAREYQWIAQHAPDTQVRADAAFRIGDLYLERSQYERSLAAYFQAISRFEKEAKAFPEVFINRAESLYWLDDADRAQTAFMDFLKEYPNHPSGWRAMLRLGELTGRKSDKEAQAASRQWLYQTVNQYPFSPGATLARLRLLPCGDHGGFTIESAQKFFSRDAETFDGAKEVRMDGYKDLRALSRVQTYMALGTPEAATDIAIADIRSGLRVHIRERITQNLESLFRKAILEQIARGDTAKALKFYEDRYAVVPKGEADPDYLLKLSQAASDQGLGGWAEKLNQGYAVASRELARRGRAVASKPTSQGKADADDLESKLAVAEEKFTEAKAMWIQLGNGIRVAKEPKQTERVVELLGSVPAESEFSFEKQIIMSLIHAATNLHASALDEALQAQFLMGKGEGDDPIRLEAWIADLQLKAGKKGAALSGFRKLQGLVSTDKKETSFGKAGKLGLPPCPTREQLILTEGEILESQNEWGEAAAAYSKAISGGIGGNHALFQYARALGKSSDASERKLAKNAFEKVAKSEVDDFWRKLAREALANF